LKSTPWKSSSAYVSVLWCWELLPECPSLLRLESWLVIWMVMAPQS